MDRTDPWFDSLYKKYAPRFVKVASLELDDRAVAEEIVHDVFCVLLLSRTKVETYDQPGAWLHKVLYNRIGNEIQRASRSRESPLNPTQEEELAGDTGEFVRLEDILPVGLSQKDRQILIWFYEDHLDCREISRRLHRTVHACEARLYRARKRCKELLLKNSKKIL